MHEANALPSPAAQACAAVRGGQFERAEALVAALVRELFALEPQRVQISRDGYSLNSVNGFVSVAGGDEYFFKFHHEEGEERTLQEFYRGELLRAAGFPVDQPAYVSRQIGRQLLLYRRRHDRRFAEICSELEADASPEAARVLTAQQDLDRLTCSIYLATLHEPSVEQLVAEPIHQLFHHRLVDRAAPGLPGGRARRFFWDRTFDLAGQRLSAERLRGVHWRINGVDYNDTLGALLERSIALLEPAGLIRFGALTAHGDAHNANVWWQSSAGGAASLVLFDPAFAGAHVCALLAEVKATFHNILAHPLWLYSPAAASARYSAQVRLDDAILEISTDWRPSPLRQQFLHAKAELLWRPLLRRLAARGLLSADWRASLRCALFCCPALVKDLCAGGEGGHTPLSSAIGLSVAVRCGSEPARGGHDEISDFLDRITPGD